MHGLPAGGLAGAIAWWSVYPLDVIKSRIQASSRAESEYKGKLPDATSISLLVLACMLCHMAPYKLPTLRTSNCAAALCYFC